MHLQERLNLFVHPIMTKWQRQHPEDCPSVWRIFKTCRDLNAWINLYKSGFIRPLRPLIIPSFVIPPITRHSSATHDKGLNRQRQWVTVTTWRDRVAPDCDSVTSQRNKRLGQHHIKSTMKTAAKDKDEWRVLVVWFFVAMGTGNSRNHWSWNGDRQYAAWMNLARLGHQVCKTDGACCQFECKFEEDRCLLRLSI